MLCVKTLQSSRVCSLNIRELSEFAVNGLPRIINAGSCSFLHGTRFISLKTVKRDYNFKIDSNDERFHLVRANKFSFLQNQSLCRRNYRGQLKAGTSLKMQTISVIFSTLHC